MRGSKAEEEMRMRGLMEVEDQGMDEAIVRGDFIEWIPNNIKTDICEILSMSMKKAVTFEGSLTAIREMFNHVTEYSTVMFEEEMFSHWCMGEGTIEMESKLQQRVCQDSPRIINERDRDEKEDHGAMYKERRMRRDQSQ